MTGKGHASPSRPASIGGFRAGDKVITPLGRRAVIIACRVDGFLDAKYTDEPWHPTLAEVILQAQTLTRMR
jgi:hypothetical protein